MQVTKKEYQIHFFVWNNLFFQLGFIPCKAGQPLQGMVELQEKEAQKD